MRVVFIVLVIRFPIALFLSWFYEITPEGLKREADVQPGESITADTGRKMNFMIAGGVLLVVAGMAIRATGDAETALTIFKSDAIVAPVLCSTYK